jgi:uncharacterized SAM-binding protein YcdF (DUF218 family)
MHHPDASPAPPPTKEAPNAVIVIFGAAVRRGGTPSLAMRQRVEAAALFAARFTLPLFVPTGGVGRHGPSEASVMARLLVEHGIPRDRILLEQTGTDTLSSARAVSRLLRQRAIVAPVFAASSRYHQPRCVMLLRLFGLRSSAAGPPHVPVISRATARWYWRLREAMALPYDATLALGHVIASAAKQPRS